MSAAKKIFRYLALILIVIILFSLIRDIFFGQFSFDENKKLEILKQKDELKDLCLSNFKSTDELNRQIFLLNRLCSVSCVTLSNINKWSKAFLDHNFPDVKYNPDSNFKKISNNYSLIKSGIEGDYKNMTPHLLNLIGNIL